MLKSLTRVALAVLVTATLVRGAGSKEIFVDAGAAPGGEGKTPATAYRTIREAVADVNERADSHDYIIHVAEGTYVEPPDMIAIRRDGVRLAGSTRLVAGSASYRRPPLRPAS